MEIRISRVDQPVRLVLDAPYIDGIRNIKAALGLENITSISGGSVTRNSGASLATRCAQLVIGGALLIPGINIIIDIAIRLLSKNSNLNGDYLPLSQKIEPSQLNGIVSENILPRLLEFLRENGYPEAAVKYNITDGELGTTSINVDIHLKDNIGLSVIVPCLLRPLPTFLPTYFSEATTEREIFADLKKRVIFSQRGIDNSSDLQEFIENPSIENIEINNIRNFRNWIDLKVTPKVLQFMQKVGLENPRFAVQINPRNNIDDFDVCVKFNDEHQQSISFHEEMDFGPISCPSLIHKILRGIILSKTSL